MSAASFALFAALPVFDASIRLFAAATRCPSVLAANFAFIVARTAVAASDAFFAAAACPSLVIAANFSFLVAWPLAVLSLCVFTAAAFLSSSVQFAHSRITWYVFTETSWTGNYPAIRPAVSHWASATKALACSLTPKAATHS
jgi:hypothetical protein